MLKTLFFISEKSEYTMNTNRICINIYDNDLIIYTVLKARNNHQITLYRALLSIVKTKWM